ncbi:hypothetical protein QFZ36_000874 [Pseudarthrobacter siccitolerans]|uniref:Uncharacterized protein n=1 Tax=Pseudarthrobacter siccitolerans TaxID=861266 RepID=A0ABU0PH80_9MICC|nr:hypothetical protein [Pseudarthrobacter siccitolerans]MDQ0690523.1 hypothetical protein [Arthrobacter sp. W4I7]
MDNDVHMVRSCNASLTRILPRGNTELMTFVTAGTVVVLTKRVAH